MILKMGSVEYGAKQAIENCLKLKKDEKLVIITDRENLEIGNALKHAAQKITKNINFYVLEDFGERPEDGVNPLKCPQEIFEALKDADVSIYCARIKKNERNSLRNPILDFINKTGRIRHAHMPDVTEEIMKTGMCADYAEIRRISKKIYDVVKDAREIRVVTEKGTDITANFDPNLKWVVSDGNLGTKGNQWSNLPDGEVFTCPANVNGHVVIDGCLGDYFKWYGDIRKTPIEMNIKRGRIVKGSIKCVNKQLGKELNDYIFNTDKNSRRIGEFAIGTNIGLNRIIGNLLQDEKFPGVHIAWGNPYPEKTGAKWRSKAHCDGVIRNPAIIVDGRKIMEKGKFKL